MLLYEVLKLHLNHNSHLQPHFQDSFCENTSFTCALEILPNWTTNLYTRPSQTWL